MAVSVGQFIGGTSSLGTLYVRLAARPEDLIKGMTQAVQTVVSGGASMNAAMAATGAAFTALATAGATSLAILAAAGVTEYAKFNKAIVNSASIMGNLSKGMRRDMEEVARDISTKGLLSAKELAGGFYFLESAGLQADQALKALPIVARFASVAFENLEQATEHLAGTQAALGLKMEDPIKNMENMQRLADLLTKGNQLALGNVKDFADALSNQAANAMREFNLNTEEGIATLAAFAERNVRGREAGERFYVMIRNMAKAAMEQRGEFERLGIQVFDTEGEFRSLSDIIGDFDKALGHMSPEVKKNELQLLGFEERAIKSILALLGASGSIREFTKEMQNAGGATKEVADKQLTSFIAQLTLTWHNIQDLLISIGEGLAGPLLEFNDWINESTKRHATLNENIKIMAEQVGHGLVVAFKIFKAVLDPIVSIFQALWAVLKTINLAFFALGEVALKVVGFISRGMSEALQNFFDFVNKMIEGVNKLGESLPDWMKPDAFKGGIPSITFQAPGFGQDMFKEWEDILKIGRQNLYKELTESSKETVQVVKKTSEEVAKETVKVFNQAAKAGEDASDRMRRAIEQASMDMKRLLDKVGAPNLKDFNDQYKEMTPTEFAIEKYSVGGFDDQTTNTMLRNNKEIELNTKKLEELKKLADQQVGLDRDTHKRLLQAQKLYAEQSRSLHLAQKEMILASGTRMFDDMSTIAEAFTGRQSGFFKTMFAMSKAFAIADASVKILQGIAAASSLPWPLNIGAMASVVAATASIVTNIQAVKLEFANTEKRARGGPLSSGIPYTVGEEGPELFVPDRPGMMIPNNRLGSSALKVVVNNYTDARPEITERNDNGERVIELMIKRTKTEISSELRDGRGSVAKSMEQTYGLRRGQTQ